MTWNRGVMMNSKKIICDYCLKTASLVTGKEIYPTRKDLHKKYFYQCVDCNAYVGCHPNSVQPLGRLANSELRKWKRTAHYYFDRLWQQRHMKRANAYKWLAKKMNINEEDCHIGFFDVASCKRVIEIMKDHISWNEFNDEIN